MNKTDHDTEYRIREKYAAFDRRIRSLEGRSGRGRALQVSALTAALAALALSGFGLRELQHAYFPGETAPTLDAQAIVLRDYEGLERGALRVQDDGRVTLTLMDDRAQPRLRLSVLEDGSPGVSLLDSDGDTRAILGLLPDGTTSLVFADGGSVARTVLAVTPDGASRIVFSDHLGEAKAAVGIDGGAHTDLETRETIAEGNPK
jgi:hypothetical protein